MEELLKKWYDYGLFLPYKTKQESDKILSDLMEETIAVLQVMGEN